MDALAQLSDALIGLIILGLVTWLVARTSRRVLGIQVSMLRAFVVSLIISQGVFAVASWLVSSGALDAPVQRNLITLVVIALATTLGAFALGLLVLMVLEVVVPTGSLPPLRALFTGWRDRLRRTGRYLRIMTILGRYGLTAQLRGVLNSGTTADSVRRAMEDAGVTFIKLGQMLSTRSDLLPEEYIKELSRLTIQADPQPFEMVDKVLTAELGADARERLEIDPVPLASASLAQVHAAVLDGEYPVVVKVQRYGAAEQAAIDLQILDRLARTLDRNADWARRLGVADIVAGFTESVADEFDYATELANMAALRIDLTGTGVRVPQADPQLCTGKVLVMERFEATPIAAAADLIAELPAEVRQRSAERLLGAVVHQIIGSGVFHADLHAGNVVVWSDGQIGLLDYGSVGRLDAGSRRNLGLLLWAVDADDAALATDAVLELLDHDSTLDERTLQRNIGVLITKMRTGGTGSTLAFFQQLLRLVLANGMGVSRSIAMAMRSLGALEGTLKQLHPQIDLVSAARDQARGVIGDISAEGAKRELANQAIRLVPLATHLPRRLNRISEDLAAGRFSTNVRVVANPDDRIFLTGLANQVVIAVLAGFAVVGAIMLITSTGGPQVYEFRVFDLLGYLLGFGGFILALRSVAMVFGRREKGR